MTDTTGHEPALSTGLNGHEPALGGPLGDGRSYLQLTADEQQYFIDAFIPKEVQRLFEMYCYRDRFSDGGRGDFYGSQAPATDEHPSPNP